MRSLVLVNYGAYALVVNTRKMPSSVSKCPVAVVSSRRRVPENSYVAVEVGGDGSANKMYGVVTA